MLANKKETTERLLAVGNQQRCVKLPIENIVFPKWDNYGLYGLMIRQYVRTKEQPDGMLYDETKFQLVLRIINGKVLITQRPDCYCWPIEKVKKADESGNVKPIGVNSASGVINLAGVIQKISDESERSLVADMFVNSRKDLMLILTPAEERVCIPVTQEMINAGYTYCVDGWMSVDANGMSSATKIEAGDFLIVQSSQKIYRIGREEFEETHTLNVDEYCKGK